MRYAEKKPVLLNLSAATQKKLDKKIEKLEPRPSRTAVIRMLVERYVRGDYDNI